MSWGKKVDQTELARLRAAVAEKCKKTAATNKAAKAAKRLARKHGGKMTTAELEQAAKQCVFYCSFFPRCCCCCAFCFLLLRVDLDLDCREGKEIEGIAF